MSSLLGVLALHASAFQIINTYTDALQQFGTDFINPARIVEQRKLIPTPIRTVPQALVIHQPVAFVNFITDLFFSSVNLALPLQIDVIVRFDDDTMKVTSYDTTLRHWSDFRDYFIPFLVPKAAEELMAANTTGVDYSSSTDIIVTLG
ncbi:hypothetical protein F5146DRAFT_1141226 [Armillaria mellea]|nr:hypothetical protein F5146DRAFT_1141226 [Armillaria mellea]